MSTLDRVLLAIIAVSAVGGLVRGGTAASIPLLMLLFSAPQRAPMWRQSTLVPRLEPGTRWIVGFVPQQVARRIDLHGRNLPSAGPVLPA